MASFSHDGDVIVYNYNYRLTDKEDFSIANPPLYGLMSTTKISLKEALTSVQCVKSKSSPYGTFSITLKGTKDWLKILVPGSWCAIYMSDSQLSSDDLTATGTYETIEGVNGSVDNIKSPLKMVGIIIAIRVQKTRTSEGTFVLNYNVTGYDFGYALTAQVYINHYFQSVFETNKIIPVFNQIAYPQNPEAYGDPVENIYRVLSTWSRISDKPLAASLAKGINPPTIGMQVPTDMASLVGTDGNNILGFIRTAIGLDKREDKVLNFNALDDTCDDFDDTLVGEKQFMPWKLIIQNTLWGMINEYLNPTLNEAYCDLHPVAPLVPNPLGPDSTLTPTLIVRQIPFSTSQYNSILMEAQTKSLAPIQSYPVTFLTEIPRTAISSEKVISYDIGYSEYDRRNFLEINGFLLNGPINASSAVMPAVNPPLYRTGSVNRFGLRPQIVMGADYGITSKGAEVAHSWTPILGDWWFNANRFANGTLECIGLSEHIALGENLEIIEDNLLCHIEGYTHTLSVNGDGTKIFRTNIEFVKGIAADSTKTEFKYIYGDASMGGDKALIGATMLEEQGSINQDDVKRVGFTASSNLKKSGGGGLGGAFSGEA